MTPTAAVVTRPLGTGMARPPAVPATRLLAAVLAVAFLLASGALLAPPAAADPAVTVPAPATSGPLTLELSGLAPRVITAEGPSSVSVTGTLRNTGDRVVGDLEVRLQRGEALRTDGDVRDALAGEGRTDAATPAFTPLPGTLAPGASMPVTLTMPLRGEPADGLALDRPGVYELLVNVNGVPRDGLRARLAAARLLLPVLSLPAGPGPGDAPVVPTVPGGPPGLTVLYPLVDTPHRLPTVPGEQTLLADDDLARSLAPDGRLGGLLAAFAEGAPAGSAVRAATCLAVDPDLVATAAAMRQGYAVRGPNGTVLGTGAEVAGAWLDTLAAAARGGCVVALPFADVDLVALARGQLGDLGRLAVADAAAVVTEALGTPVLDATTWPNGGVLDEPALAGVADAGTRAVVLDAATVDGDSGTAGAVPVAVGPSSLLAVLTDPLLARAADAPGSSAPAIPGTATTVSATTVSATTSPPLATQDVAAALVFRAQAATQPAGGPPIVLAPPHVWRTDKTGAGALLATVNLLLDAGRVRGRPLADVVAAGPTTRGAARRPADPLQAGSRDIPPTVLESVREMRADVLDLRSAAVPETGVGATVDATFEPLLQAVLRPASATWHGRPDLATSAATAAGTRIGELRDSIRVLTPPSPYSLATTDAPLLLTVANGLPVTMEVRLSISSTTGLRVAPIPPQRIPPLGRRQVQVSAEVVRSGQFSVEATVHSPAGRALGPPSRLQVRSTAYGTITVWLTGSAGVLLIVLAAHRVVRRIRGEASPRDRTGPSVGPPTPEAPTPETPTPETPRPEPDAAAPALLRDLP
ncbi:MAG TPA: DUF6049 family protein, partial [Pseudonocardia sp.]|nr:DUF6049 family protein [Pseudonocardia sp.]